MSRHRKLSWQTPPSALFARFCELERDRIYHQGLAHGLFERRLLRSRESLNPRHQRAL